MNQPTFIFSTENDWGVDSQNSTEISVQLKTEMESSRQRGDFDAKTSGSSSKTSLVSSPDKQSKRRASAASSTWAMRMMALHISGDVKLWAGNLSRAVAPGLDELHASPSSFLPKIGQEFTCWRGNNSASDHWWDGYRERPLRHSKNSRNPNIFGQAEMKLKSGYEAVTKILKIAQNLAFPK